MRSEDRDSEDFGVHTVEARCTSTRAFERGPSSTTTEFVSQSSAWYSASPRILIAYQLKACIGATTPAHGAE